MAISRLDGVAEVAAYAVLAGPEGTEDEVMLAIVPGAGPAGECPRRRKGRRLRGLSAAPVSPVLAHRCRRGDPEDPDGEGAQE